MDEIEQIKKALVKTNIQKVAKDIGVDAHYIYRFMAAKPEAAKYLFVIKLKEYLSKPQI